MGPDMLAALRCCLVFPMVLASGALHGAENWPAFRGPHGDGHAEASDLPVTWSETENVGWKTPVHGKAWSSPVVWEQQIWMTTAPEDGTSMGAVCVDLASGRIVHDIKLWDVAEPQFCYPFNSYASSTPVIEAGRLYVHFGTHGTACLDTASGKILWKRLDLHCNHHRGAGSSPIVFENLLILTFDGYDVQFLIALDKATGETVWRRDRQIEYHSDNGDVKKSYSTPQVIEVDGQLQMISPSSAAMIAYDPRTGEELWRTKTGGFNAASRPLYGLGLVFASTEGGWNLFAVDPHGRGDITATNMAWKSAKGTPRRSSPLLIGERLYTAGDNGIAACI
jgi:outer membrane protein assembly factor BamB